MLSLFEKKKKNEIRKFGCKRSPFDPNDLYWDEHGVYKKVYIDKGNETLPLKNRGNE